MNSPKYPSFKERFSGYLQFSLSILVLLIIVKKFIFQTYYIPSSSMEPTFNKGDRILVCKIIHKIFKLQKGDIIIFKLPQSKTNRVINFGFFRFKYHRWKNYIKRLIAVEGDTVEISNGTLYINGKEIKEPYIKEPPYYTYPKRKIPKGKLFVLGDNRNNSQDSHIWGFINKNDVIAKAILIWNPISRIRVIH